MGKIGSVSRYYGLQGDKWWNLGSGKKQARGMAKGKQGDNGCEQFKRRKDFCAIIKGKVYNVI